MTCTNTPFLSTQSPVPQRILVLEYLTAGGLYREDIPPALAQEAVLMRDAMMGVVAALPGLEIFSAHDARMPTPVQVSRCHVMGGGDMPWQVWESLIHQVDLVWLVAPESDGALLKLTELVESSGKILLSSAYDAVRIASSKWLTYQQLNAFGVPVVPTVRVPDCLPARHGWVTKPDDGVSCDDARYFSDRQGLSCWLANAPLNYIVQPYIEGTAASVTMLCRQGQSWLLTCNRQLVRIIEGHIQYQGGIVNGMVEYWTECEQIAQQVAAAMPDLFGYVGVDLVVTAEGQLHVLEVNPRLTTSFAGLSDAIGYNPARLLLDLFYNADFKLPSALQRNRIEINLND